MNKMYASAKVGESIHTVYACGFEYDDFSEGGFAVFAICDSVEAAEKAIEKAKNEAPSVDLKAFYFKPYRINKYYSSRWA